MAYFVKNVGGFELFKSSTAATIKQALVEAVKSRAELFGANLSGADLSGADLSRANLSGANLSGANLSGANLFDADLSRANLSRANLFDADLSRANLFGANLSGADLSRAKLSGAELSGANLSGANLFDADLSRANLSRANLFDAELSGANLFGADLSGANLFGANGCHLTIAQTRILPEGELIGWKKCQDGVIVKLCIPNSAKRSHALGRKCRAEFVDVIEVFGADVGISYYDKALHYRAGERVVPDKFDEDWKNECSSGVHFYITRIEAENHRF